VVYAVYVHHTWNYPPERQRADTVAGLAGHGVGHTPKDIVVWASDKPVLRPGAQYFSGLFQSIQRAVSGNSHFFLGEISASGSPDYFPIVYLIKEPLALHLLTVLALVFAFSRLRRPLFRRDRLEARFPELAFLVVISLYWCASISSNLNIGVRHLLPTLPFLYILVANEIVALGRSLRPTRRVLLVALFAWQAVSVLRVHPSYLAYFNEAAGGPDGGWIYVLDSNLDWGQDLKRLARFVEQRDIAEIHLDYFGSADPAYYLKGKQRGGSGCLEPQKGWIAVSATVYQGAPWNPQCDYRRWLPLEKLVAKVGYSLFVFHND
jgi:hypothetical protein